MAKKDIDRFFTELSVKVKIDIPIESKFYRDLTITNDPFKSIPLLQQLWRAKNNPAAAYSPNNRDTLETLLRHITAEFSLVLDQSPDKIYQKLISILGK